MNPKLLIPALSLALVHGAGAFTISFSQADFDSVTPTFSSVSTFDFSITVDEPLVAGQTYSNPALTSVVYSVNGSLGATPSGFPAFALVRNILGSDFYTQGSSLNFQVSPTANLLDGLQLSEFTGTDPVFVFNGREVGTGRYHPSLLQLNADGTGLFQNSNNQGGINPGSGMVVDVDFGEEYITLLAFTPAPVPEPSRLLLVLAGFGLVSLRRRRT